MILCLFFSPIHCITVCTLIMSTGDTVLEFGSENRPKKRIQHPLACFFHIIFRLSALIVYLICGILGVGFVKSFIIILLLLCADFWTVKNITGRLLVGLRWWNQVSADGQSKWVYESRKPAALKRHPVLPAESRLVTCFVKVLWEKLKLYICIIFKLTSNILTV